MAIIGGGLTGLWTAYYLKRESPDLKIQIFEANHIAFGASGRAGGWAIASLDNQAAWLKGLDSAAAEEAVGCISKVLDEIETVLERERISCGYHRGGMVRIAARNDNQKPVLRKYSKAITAEHAGDVVTNALDEAQAHAMTPMSGAREGFAFENCAVLNPAKLAHGLARALSVLGVDIYENCRALSWADGEIITEKGRTTAKWVVPALEAYSATLGQTAGRVIPVYSHVIATEPLSANMRASIGLGDRQAFSDCSSISTYGQITEDNRIVFGALASYPFRGRLGALSDSWVRKQYKLTHQTLIKLWPQLKDTAITHAWSGPLGVPRSFKPSIVLDESKRIVWGGGYVGRGIAASNLFGRTMSELILDRDTPRTRCPWVHRGGDLDETVKRWEPEPLRWLGIAAVTAPGRLKERALQSRLPAPLKSLIAWIADLIPEGR